MGDGPGITKLRDRAQHTLHTVKTRVDSRVSESRSWLHERGLDVLASSDKSRPKGETLTKPTRGAINIPAKSWLPSNASPLARAIYKDAAPSIKNGNVPAGIFMTSANSADATPFLAGPQIFPGMRDLISGAKREVAMQTFEWESGSDAAKNVMQGFAQLAQNRKAYYAAHPGETVEPVQVKMLVNQLSIGYGKLGARQHSYDDLTKDVKALIQSDPSVAKYLHFEVLPHRHRLTGANHSKSLVVDGDRAIIGGANIQKQAGLDATFRINGDAALALRSDIADSWHEERKKGSIGDTWRVVTGGARKGTTDFDPMPLPSSRGPGSDDPRFDSRLRLFESALGHVKANFGYFDTAKKGGDGDGIISKDDLAAVAANAKAPEHLHDAAKFLISNPDLLDAVDTGAKGGDADGRISREDVDVALRELKQQRNPIAGNTPMMLLTRPADGHLIHEAGDKLSQWAKHIGINKPLRRDLDNPADKAILSVFRNAKHEIHIMSPNLNDDAMKAAIKDAARRGVKVHIVVPQHFNDKTEVKPGQGGTNEQNVTALLREMKDYPNLDIRWFNGIAPGTGHGQEVSHTKYLTADGQIAIVGSTNLDTQSINHSRETNLLVDSADTVKAWDGALFDKAFARGRRIEI